MFGKILSTAIKTITLPIDAANAGMDMISGGDGSKKSRCNGSGTPTEMLEKLRDRIAEAAESVDD